MNGMTSTAAPDPDQPQAGDSPETLTAAASALVEEVKGVRDDLTLVNAELAKEKKWRTRFALAVGAFVLLAIAFGVVTSIVLASNHRTSQHLSQVIACTNMRNSQFVSAISQRSLISTSQSQALEKLLSQVLHITNAQEFTDDVHAYIAAAGALTKHPLPAYPANACT
jgi:hypothetical protein